MAISENLKQKIDELDLDRRVNDVVEQVERTVTTVLDKAGDYAHAHRDDLESWIEKAGSRIDERTDGKFAEPVAKVQGRAAQTVAKLAQRGAAHDAPTTFPEEPPQHL
jgi:Cft2 family RNA processing exonuclease